MATHSTSLHSLWLARPVAPRETEIVVVGAGIAGLSVAWWLSRAGHRVLVVDAGRPAERASGRNAGFLLTGTAEPYVTLRQRIGEEAALALWQRSRENRELLQVELFEGVGLDCDFRPEGSWNAAVMEPVQVEQLQDSYEALRKEGFELEWQDRVALEERGARGLGGAIVQRDDGGLDPVQLCRGLISSAGLEVERDRRVTGIHGDGDSVVVEWDGGSCHAEQAVLAMNAYSALLVEELDAIRPVRGQVLATRLGPRHLEGVWYCDSGFEYVRQLADGRVVAGGGRRKAEATEEGYQELPTATVQGAIEEFLANTFPQLAGRSIEHRWAGIMGFTVDGLPLVGPLEDRTNQFVSAGFNGHGVSFAFAAGHHVARLMRGDAEEPFLPSPVPESVPELQ